MKKKKSLSSSQQLLLSGSPRVRKNQNGSGGGSIRSRPPSFGPWVTFPCGQNSILLSGFTPWSCHVIGPFHQPTSKTPPPNSMKAMTAAPLGWSIFQSGRHGPTSMKLEVIAASVCRGLLSTCPQQRTVNNPAAQQPNSQQPIVQQPNSQQPSSSATQQSTTNSSTTQQSTTQQLSNPFSIVENKYVVALGRASATHFGRPLRSACPAGPRKDAPRLLRLHGQ